jgi:peptidoglycan hydrolase-like protein with peptidoglycan-binding domain
MKVPALLASLVFATSLISTTATSVAVPPPPRHHHPGEATPVAVQRRLAHLGYYHGAIDGEIGPHSRRAIRRYQADHGLPVTGEIDRPLLRSLGL